jgi:hypothetical protein
MLSSALKDGAMDSITLWARNGEAVRQAIELGERLLLDSRDVNLSMASNPILVIRSSLKPLFFNGLKNELRFLDNAGA